MDVVYNHTNAAGPERQVGARQGRARLLPPARRRRRRRDQHLLPEHGHRARHDGEADGRLACSPGRRAYKVDGFRFDLMGHHMKSQHAARSATASTPSPWSATASTAARSTSTARAGTSARWPNNARGVNATQHNMAGTGIGTFNDRLRDAVRGGGPFSGLQEQGFATGLWSRPQRRRPAAAAAEQRALLLYHADWIRLGLAGNLRDYHVRGPRRPHRAAARRSTTTGSRPATPPIRRRTSTTSTAHDNETLFDAIAAQGPGRDARWPTRVRHAQPGRRAW